MIAKIVDNKHVVLGVILFFHVIGALWYAYHFIIYGYLPTPFISDKSNTFMDYYNVLYWAYDDGRYTEWKSIYPPLVFLLLKWSSLFVDVAGGGAAFELRDKYGFLIGGILLSYFIVPLFIINKFYDKGYVLSEKVMMYCLIILSTPMLFALERGNLIIYIPLLFVYVFSDNEKIKALGIALLINVKPYFAVLLLYYSFMRDYKGFFYSVGFAFVVFVVSGELLGGEYWYFIKSLSRVSFGGVNWPIHQVMSLDSSISAISCAFNKSALSYFNYEVNGSEIIRVMIEVVKWVGVVASIIAAFFAGRVKDGNMIIVLLVVAITNVAVMVGGYSIIFYWALLPYMLNRKYSTFYVCVLIIMSLPVDIVSLWRSNSYLQYSYLSAKVVNVEWTLGLGAIVRPVLNYLIMMVLVADILRQTYLNGLMAIGGNITQEG